MGSSGPEGDPAGRVARTALAHLLAGILTRPDSDWTVEDVPELQGAATVACYRMLVAAAAVEAGRVSGDWPPSDVDRLLDRVGAAFPGWLFEADADRPGAGVLAELDVDPDRRRDAVVAISKLVEGDGGATNVSLGTVHESLLAVDATATESTDDGGRSVVTAEEWSGPAVVLSASDDRKDGGAYYTPEPVVEGIVETALAPITDRIRVEGDGNDESGGGDGTDRGRNSESGGGNSGVEDGHGESEGSTDGGGDGERNHPRPAVRVLDPAVGTGRFLVAAVEHLTDAVLDGRDGGEPTRGQSDSERDRLRRRIAEECVYGVDVDPMAVELGRAALWIHTGGDPGDHLRAGDALLGPGPGGGEDRGTPTAPDGRDVVDWPAAFPSVLEDGGRFDAVVGNPPYVRSREVSERIRSALREQYRTARGAFDLYVPFFERAAELGERVAFVVPNKWTAAEYGRALRAALVDEWCVETLTDCSEMGLFDDADVYPVVVSYAPGTGEESTGVVSPLDVPGAGEQSGDGGSASNAETRDRRATRDVRIRTVADPRAIGSAGEDATSVPVSLLDRLGGVIPVGMDPELVDTVDRVVRECGQWGEYAETTEGIHTGNVREKLVVEDPVGDRCRPLVDGRSIERYRAWPSGEWVRYDPEIVGDGEYADLRDPSLFEGPKVLIRDISERPVAAYDESGLYALNTLYVVRPTGDLPAKYLLSVFNSAFVDRFFRAVYAGTHVRDGYLRFKPAYLDRVPVPDPDPDTLEPATRRRVAAHPATPTANAPAIDTPEAVTDALAVLSDVVAEAKARRAAVGTDPTAYFDPGAASDRLGELAGVERSPSVRETPLTETTRDRAGLRIGDVTVTADGRALVIRATARYKPEGDEGADCRWTGGDGGTEREWIDGNESAKRAGTDGNEGVDRRSSDGDEDAERGRTGGTDQWGYVETEPIPAFRVDRDAVGRKRAEVLRAVVPAAVGNGGTTPATAAKTITPLDRIAGVGIPRPGSPAADLPAYRAARRRAGALARGGAVADALVDRVVADLYGLDDRERELVGRSVADRY